MNSLLEEEQRKKEPINKGLNIKNERCERCLFGENPHIEWRYGKNIVRKALSKGTHFCCLEYQDVMCHGFYKKYEDKIWYIRWAKYLKMINWVRN